MARRRRGVSLERLVYVFYPLPLLLLLFFFYSPLSLRATTPSRYLASLARDATHAHKHRGTRIQFEYKIFVLCVI